MDSPDRRISETWPILSDRRESEESVAGDVSRQSSSQFKTEVFERWHGPEQTVSRSGSFFDAFADEHGGQTPAPNLSFRPGSELTCSPVDEHRATTTPDPKAHKKAAGDKLAAVTEVRRCVDPPPQPLGCASAECPDHFGCKFEVPPLEQRKSALGNNGGLAFYMQRIVKFSEVWFEPIREPRTSDWLRRHKELSQTFEEYRSAVEKHRDNIVAAPPRKCIHILPVGPLAFDPTFLARIRDIVAAFFYPVKVTLLPRQQSEPFPDFGGGRRSTMKAVGGTLGTFDGSVALKWLASGRRSDSLLMFGITVSGLLDDSGNDTTGTTDWKSRVGIFSVSAYVRDVVREGNAYFPFRRLDSKLSELDSDTEPSSARSSMSDSRSERNTPCSFAIAQTLCRRISGGSDPGRIAPDLVQEATKVMKLIRTKMKERSWRDGTYDFAKIFRHADRDESGYIEWHEFYRLCKKQFHLNCRYEVLKAVFNSIDCDASGKVDIREFIAVAIDPTCRLRYQLQCANWQSLTDKLKDENDGITWKQFKFMCRESLKIMEDDDYLRTLFAAVDFNCTGKVTVQQLISFTICGGSTGILPRRRRSTGQLRSRFGRAQDVKQQAKSQSGYGTADAQDFEKVAKFVLHQATHMFGILHCCYYRCIMNGAANDDEEETRPPFLCALCLKKLHLVLGFHPLERYLKLSEVWKSLECFVTSAWYDTRVAMVQSTLLANGTPRARRPQSANLKGCSPMMPATVTKQVSDVSRPESTLWQSVKGALTANNFCMASGTKSAQVSRRASEASAAMTPQHSILGSNTNLPSGAVPSRRVSSTSPSKDLVDSHKASISEAASRRGSSITPMGDRRSSVGGAALEFMSRRGSTFTTQEFRDFGVAVDDIPTKDRPWLGTKKAKDMKLQKKWAGIAKKYTEEGRCQDLSMPKQRTRPSRWSISPTG